LESSRKRRLRFVNFRGTALRAANLWKGAKEMRLFAALVFGFCAVGLLACSKTPPPAGRWEGTYDAADVIVAVRLEIDAKGNIYLSAPDAMNFPAVSEDERSAMHQRLAQGLASGWSDVTSRSYEFDGQIFRKPGGVAPQMEWDSGSKRMTVIVYLERRPGIRIAMRAVSEFSDNPWSTTS
jgi:hypothetical protein